MTSGTPTPSKAITGGEFLIRDVRADEIFTPEEWTEEHRMMLQTGLDFVAQRIIPNLERIESQEEGLTPKLLEEVGLKGRELTRPSKLSGGQQQRVAVARAMASKPDIILADEPTANLDSTTGIALLDMMRELNAQMNMTFVFSTHDQKIMDRADRLIHLEDGVIQLDEIRSS